MLQKIQKNRSKITLCLALLAVMLAGVFASMPQGYAYDFTNPTVLSGNDVCPDTEGFTARIVTCIKETILYAINDFIVPFSDHVSDWIYGACLLAIAIWGVAVATGKQGAIVREGAVVFIKIGAVMYFTNDFGGLYPDLLDMMEYMLDAVTAYVGYSPSFECSLLANPSESIGIWQRVDCTIEALIGGIVSRFNIFFGITGFLVSALFSQSIGLFIGLIGFLIIGQLLWAIVRGVYIFLSAYIAFALMVVISPLFIPLILFSATKGYFDKWLRITMGFMLQPIFLFTYLAMLMAAYDTVVYTGDYSLYRNIAGDAVDDPSFKIGDWVYNNGIYGESSQSSQAYNVDPRKMLDIDVQDTNVGVLGTGRDDANIDVKLTEQVTDPAEWSRANGLPRDIIASRLNILGYFRVDLPVKAIDWERLASLNDHDPNNLTPYWIELLLSCLMALLISYIFLLMLDLLPFIGSGVAGDILSMPAFGTGPFAPPGDGAVTGLKSKLMGNIMGGR